MDPYGEPLPRPFSVPFILGVGTGNIMEKYVKGETIGRGSYAKVKKVHLASSGDVFAMKVCS